MEPKNLSKWIEEINAIYDQANGDRDFKDVLLYAFEEVGRCSQLIKMDKDDAVKEIVPNLFKWFCILYKKSGLLPKDVNSILWNKFPGICPYCNMETCNCPDTEKDNIKIAEITKIANEKRSVMPETLSQWQDLFDKIYPRGQGSKISTNISHLNEELSELSEVHRKSYLDNTNILVSFEIADVFTWIIGLANYFKHKNSKKYSIEAAVNKKYGDGQCPDCKEYKKSLNIESKDCFCAVMPQKIVLVSDYIEDDEIKQKEDKTSHKTTQNNLTSKDIAY